MHLNYERLVELARGSHERGRDPAGITPADIGLARLYCYAFRAHTIGAFHATRLALRELPETGALATAHRRRAVEALEDLADGGMETIPTDFRALLSSFYRTHRGVTRVLSALENDGADEEIARIAARFRASVEEITGSNGLVLTRDIGAPVQASFVVPNLGITIVPLVYGDHHSWNLAYLPDPRGGVPTHRHHQGVEIHLGYAPLEGDTILGGAAAAVSEGYAMPIPPETWHGYRNGGDLAHHVPFIFGSLRHGGWGVFLDVDAQGAAPVKLESVPRDAPEMPGLVYLEREIEAAARQSTSGRRTLIASAVTDRDGSGGLELSLNRADERGLTLPTGSFRAVSVVRGAGRVSVGNDHFSVERDIEAHDHFGIPTGLCATLHQIGAAPLVVLDAVIQ